MNERMNRKNSMLQEQPQKDKERKKDKEREQIDLSLTYLPYGSIDMMMMMSIHSFYYY